jgi:hypothetical protein
MGSTVGTEGNMGAGTEGNVGAGARVVAELWACARASVRVHV